MEVELSPWYGITIILDILLKLGGIVAIIYFLYLLRKLVNKL
ncbi:hypothetical protein [Gottfriedia solisilvae]|uniref:Uncharacterized protein n=1 Tax=Gottfriedia solisilvae TaxID=1516104 RepID=A0A8J3ACV7_9BACI|nr:hypothetical protein [Gottfriedia solisilvae]GGI11584.1 hypothetical protein GCM10007380_08570 [Gottfriedia solisilvae]